MPPKGDEPTTMSKAKCQEGMVPLTGKKVIAIYLDAKGTGDYDQIEGYSSIEQGKCVQPGLKTVDDGCPSGYCGILRQGVWYCYKGTC
jgi:hypothetical protein